MCRALLSQQQSCSFSTRPRVLCTLLTNSKEILNVLLIDLTPCEEPVPYRWDSSTPCAKDVLRTCMNNMTNTQHMLRNLCGVLRVSATTHTSDLWCQRRAEVSASNFAPCTYTAIANYLTLSPTWSNPLTQKSNHSTDFCFWAFAVFS